MVIVSPAVDTLVGSLIILAFGVWRARVNGAKPARAIAWLALLAALVVAPVVASAWVPISPNLAGSLLALAGILSQLAVLIALAWALSYPARAFNRLLRPGERAHSASSGSSSSQSSASSSAASSGTARFSAPEAVNGAASAASMPSTASNSASE